MSVGAQRRRVISVDASFRDGVCGVAAVLHGTGYRHWFTRVLFMDTCRAATTAEAELSALSKAMEIAANAGWSNVLFRADASLKLPAELVPGAVNWRLKQVPRRQNVSAHTAASEALKLWEAGVRGELTLV